MIIKESKESQYWSLQLVDKNLTCKNKMKEKRTHSLGDRDI